MGPQHPDANAGHPSGGTDGDVVPGTTDPITAAQGTEHDLDSLSSEEYITEVSLSTLDQLGERGVKDADVLATVIRMLGQADQPKQATLYDVADLFERQAIQIETSSGRTSRIRELAALAYVVYPLAAAQAVKGTEPEDPAVITTPAAIARTTYDKEQANLSPDARLPLQAMLSELESPMQPPAPAAE
jgi:hypothetical protein